MSVFHVGDRVTPRQPVEPFYSGKICGNPKVVILPGQVGVVGALDVPVVRRVSKRAFYNCVDFVLPGVFQGHPKHENCTWRCSLADDEMTLAGDSSICDQCGAHVPPLPGETTCEACFHVRVS